MAEQRESDEAGREAIAAHLREGEELLWVGRAAKAFTPELVSAWAVLVSGGVTVAGTWLLVAAALAWTAFAWVVVPAASVLCLGWLAHALAMTHWGRRYGVTSRRIIVTLTTKGAPVHSFDLAGHEEACVAGRRGEPSGTWLAGSQPRLVVRPGDVAAVEQAVGRARRSMATAPRVGWGPAPDGGPGEEAAGPLAALLRPGERVLWAGRPGWTLADGWAATAFLVAAAVVVTATRNLTEWGLYDYERWATGIGAVGLCLLVAAVFLWQARRRAWWAVTSQRVCGTWGPGRQWTTWADLDSVGHLFLVEWSGGWSIVGFRMGLPSPPATDAGTYRSDVGTLARAGFFSWRGAAGFYHALSDARRAAVQRPDGPTACGEQALWSGPAFRSGLRAWTGLPALTAGSLALAGLVVVAVDWMAADMSNYLMPLRSSMAFSAGLCGLAWWYASRPPGGDFRRHVVTSRRVITTHGLFDALFVSVEPGSISEVMGGRFRRQRLRVAPGSGGRSLRVRGDPREAAEAIRQARDACRGVCGPGEPALGAPAEPGGLPPAALKPGERLLWAGRECARPLGGTMWAGLAGAVLGCTAGVGAMAFGALPLWALPFSAVAGGALGIAVFFGVWRFVAVGRQYAVTSQRVVARNGVPLSRVRSVDLATGRDLTLVERVDGVGDVTLVDGSRDERAGALRSLGPWVVGRRRLVLHGVPQAAEVFKLIQWARAEALRERDGEEGHGEDAGER